MILRIFLKLLKPYRYEGRFFTLKIKFTWIIITWVENTIVKNILGGTLFPLIFFWRIILDLNWILTWKGTVNRRDTRRLFWEGHYSHYFFWKDYFGIKLSFNVKREGQPGLPQRYTETAYGFVPSTTAISHSITISCPQLHSITIPIYNYVGSTLMSHDHYK